MPALPDVVILAIWILTLGVKAWALIDCVRRPAAAFPAVGRQTKALWLILTGLAFLVGLLPGEVLGLLGIAGIVIALVYVFDVRERIRELLGR